MTNSKGRNIFVSALDDAFDRQLSEDLIKAKRPPRPSRENRNRINYILLNKTAPPTEVPKTRLPLGRRAVAAILIAAILLLTGCAVAVVYRNEISGFIEYVFNDHVVVTPDGDGDYPDTIEKAFEFTYIPEGYELVKTKSGFTAVVYDYENSEGSAIRLSQIVNDGGIMFDNEYSSAEVIEIGELNVYYTNMNDFWYSYVAIYDGYKVEIEADFSIPENELEKIFSGIF